MPPPIPQAAASLPPRPPPMPPRLPAPARAVAAAAAPSAAGRAESPQVEAQARLGIFDKPPKDEEAREGSAPSADEGTSGEDGYTEDGAAEGDPVAEAAKAEAEVEAEAKREGLTGGGDAPGETGKAKYKRSALDPVMMGKGVIGTFDRATKFIYKVGARKYETKAEMEEACREMSFSDEEIEWAAADLADLIEMYRKTFTPETRVAISSGPLAAMRVLDVINRLMNIRGAAAEEEERPRPGGGGAGAPARFRTVPG